MLGPIVTAVINRWMLAFLRESSRKIESKPSHCASSFTYAQNSRDHFTVKLDKSSWELSIFLLSTLLLHIHKWRGEKTHWKKFLTWTEFILWLKRQLATDEVACRSRDSKDTKFGPRERRRQKKTTNNNPVKIVNYPLLPKHTRPTQNMAHRENHTRINC